MIGPVMLSDPERRPLYETGTPYPARHLPLPVQVYPRTYIDGRVILNLEVDPTDRDAYPLTRLHSDLLTLVRRAVHWPPVTKATADTAAQARAERLTVDVLLEQLETDAVGPDGPAPRDGELHQILTAISPLTPAQRVAWWQLADGPGDVDPVAVIPAVVACDT